VTEARPTMPLPGVSESISEAEQALDSALATAVTAAGPAGRPTGGPVARRLRRRTRAGVGGRSKEPALCFPRALAGSGRIQPWANPTRKLRTRLFLRSRWWYGLRRSSRRPPARESPRRDHPPRHHQRRRPGRPPRQRPPHPPPAGRLAPRARMADPVDKHLRAARRSGLTSPDPVRTPTPQGTSPAPGQETKDEPHNRRAAEPAHPEPPAETHRRGESHYLKQAVDPGSDHQFCRRILNTDPGVATEF
jgi:hypothetical protein